MTAGVWSKQERLMVSAILLAMGCLMVASLRQMSPTYDEPAHVVSGLAYWQLQDTRLFPEHPPLAKMVAALPLTLLAPRPNYGDEAYCGRAPCEWVFPERYFEQTKDAAGIIFMARLPMVLVTLLLGLVVYQASRKLFGTAGAMLSLLTYAGSPFFLGYGGLAITDVMLGLFCLCCCLAFVNMGENNGWKAVFWLGAAFTGACLTKFSAGLMLPVFLIAMLLRQRKEIFSSTTRRFAVQILCSLAVTAVAVTLFYAVFCGHTSAAQLLRERADSFQQSPGWAERARHMAGWLDAHPAAARWGNPISLYMTGMICFLAWLNLPGYALGAYHTSGVWYYFPTAFLFKTAPVFLLTLAVLVLLWLRRKMPGSGRADTPANSSPLLQVILVALAVFALSSMASNINLGIRHFSVPIVLLHVVAGAVMPWLKEASTGINSRLLQTGAVVFAAGLLLTVAMGFPNYIGYFNALRGSVPPQEIVTDSNLDWGESYPAIEAFRQEHAAQHMYVNSFTLLDPGLYISGAKAWTCGNPVPQDAEWLAVSANFMTQGAPNCNHLLRFEHWTIGQETVYIFRIRKLYND